MYVFKWPMSRARDCEMLRGRGNSKRKHSGVEGSNELCLRSFCSSLTSYEELYKCYIYLFQHETGNIQSKYPDGKYLYIYTYININGTCRKFQKKKKEHRKKVKVSVFTSQPD